MPSRTARHWRQPSLIARSGHAASGLSPCWLRFVNDLVFVSTSGHVRRRRQPSVIWAHRPSRAIRPTLRYCVGRSRPAGATAAHLSWARCFAPQIRAYAPSKAETLEAEGPVSTYAAAQRVEADNRREKQTETEDCRGYGADAIEPLGHRRHVTQSVPREYGSVNHSSTICLPLQW